MEATHQPETAGAEKIESEKSISNQRQPAIKAWIKELLEGSYVSQSGWEPNFLKTIAGDVARANLFGVIVSKTSTDLFNYEFFVLDDGSGRITIRTFEKNTILNDFNIGEIVSIIGRPREYGKEIYIAPEIIRKIDNPLWIEVRKLELQARKMKTEANNSQKSQNKDEINKEEIIIEEVISTPKEYIMKIIKDNDRGEGFSIEEIIQLTKTKNPNSQETINQLMQNGDIFEVKPGKVKVL